MDTALLIEKLNNTHSLNKDEALQLIKQGAQHKNLLFALAQETAEKSFGRQIFVRGLIEFTNYCKNDCYYCGIRRSNKNAARYRLTQEEILECCRAGYGLGFRTFVLQGGEDYFYSDEDIAAIVRAIKAQHPDCAVTLSIGERSRETYALWKQAGADRYLLRHETADCAHYAKLHPAELSAQNRQNCLYTLKELGYQAGAGFMVGSPYQTAENLADDLMFLQKLRPQMIGIGPFIPHHDTPFKNPQAAWNLLWCCLQFCGFYFRTCFFRQQRRWALWPRAAGFWALRPVQTLLCPIFRRRTYAANTFCTTINCTPVQKQPKR